MNETSGFTSAVVILALYFLPGLVAWKRGHHQTSAIFMLSLLLGWTLLGWAVGMIWACTAVRPREGQPVRAASRSVPAIDSEAGSGSKVRRRPASTGSSMLVPFGVALAVSVTLALVWFTPSAEVKPDYSVDGESPEDLRDLTTLGELALAQGLASKYRMTPWNRTFDLVMVSSLLSDARDAAIANCKAIRAYGVRPGWAVRVFLPADGKQPTATCTP